MSVLIQPLVSELEPQEFGKLCLQIGLIELSIIYVRKYTNLSTYVQKNWWSDGVNFVGIVQLTCAIKINWYSG